MDAGEIEFAVERIRRHNAERNLKHCIRVMRRLLAEEVLSEKAKLSLCGCPRTHRGRQRLTSATWRSSRTEHRNAP